MNTRKVSAATRERLLRAARQAMKNAYAPFSNFKVGAAILTSKGEIFVGCNVENSSYGMTNCAERTAIFSAVAKCGPGLESSRSQSRMTKACHAPPAEPAVR